MHHLWAGVTEADRLPILDMLHELTSPDKDPSSLDDISALLIPLADGTKKRSFSASSAEDLSADYSPVESQLRSAAFCLAGYEKKLRPNPIASLQRIVLLARRWSGWHRSGNASPPCCSSRAAACRWFRHC
jgi:hypothetical protein